MADGFCDESLFAQIIRTFHWKCVYKLSALFSPNESLSERMIVHIFELDFW